MNSPRPLQQPRPPGRTRLFLLALTVICCLLVAGSQMAAALTADTLRCETQDSPVGVDAAAPRLSWLPQSSQRGDSVSAYQVLVASSAAKLAANVGDRWDSGKVASGENALIPYGGSALTSWQQVFWKVRLWNGADVASDWSANAAWTMGVLNAADWTAQWVTPSTAATDVGSTLLRKNFAVGTGLVRAVIAVSGLGHCETTINGVKANADFLTPGWTKYDKTVLYDTYDVTALLQSGTTNAVGLMLGNGMYNIPNNSGRYTKITQSYGARKAIAQLRLEYSNGTVQTVGTDATWKWSNGPVSFNTIYGGEDYDARLEQPGWNLAGFNDASWTAATATTGPGGALRGASFAAPPMRVQQIFNTVTPALSGTAASVVYDFGQNAAQIPTITVHGTAGATVTLSPSELGSPGPTGSISQIASPCYLTYTLKGSTASAPETFTPRFFYTGYRYLKIDLGGTVTVDSLSSAVVHGNSDAVGTFASSNTLFNNIRTLIRWAQRSNAVSIFTDCPTREKLGWVEEIYLNGPALRYEFDLSGLYAKAMRDMADSQTGSGVIPTTAPCYLGSGGDFGDTPEWDSSFILCAWQQYQFTGDTRLLSQYYAAMKSFVSYLGTRSSGYIVNYGLGDWYDLGPNGLGYAQLTPVALTATGTYYRDVVTLSQIAQVLGNTADVSTYNTLASNIRAAFNAKFYNDSTGSYSTGSQTANAMPLVLGLPDPANVPKVRDALVQSIRGNGNAMTSGDIGMGYLGRALTENGRADVVFDMHTRLTSPGYGYILSRGATSMTEGWDGSNSQDHFMLGEITEWFYHDLAGIQGDPAGPGFKRIIVRPLMVGDLSSVNATYRSVRGNIVSNWTNGPSGLTMHVTIPPAATATVYVPAAQANLVQENGVPATSSPGVQYLRTEGNAAVFAVGSGTFDFASVAVANPPTGLAATLGGSQVNLTWTAPTNANRYNVRRGVTSGGPYDTLVGSNVAATGFSDAGAAAGNTYYYVVSSVNSASESANSAQTSVALTPPGAPAGLAASPGNGVAVISWNAVPGVTNYRVKRGTSSAGPFSTVAVNATPGLAFVDTGLTNGTTYYYVVSGLVFDAEGTAAAPVSVTPAATPASLSRATGGTPSANTPGGSTPESFDKVFDGSTSTKWYETATGSTAWVQYQFAPGLAWRITEYRISSANDVPARDPKNWQLLGSNDGATWTTLDTRTGETFSARNMTKAYTFTNSTSYRFYRLNITANNGESGIQLSEFSLWSSAADMGDKTPPVLTLPAPITVNATDPNGATVAYTATAVDAVSGPVLVNATPPSSSLFPVGTTTVQATATDAAGNPATGSFPVTVRFIPAAPTGLTATGGPSQVALNWSAVSGATSYGIKRGSGGSGTFVTLNAAPTVPTFTDTGLTNGTPYSYRVFAVNGGNNSDDSNLATATPQAPPITPAELTAPRLTPSNDRSSLGLSMAGSVAGHMYQLQSTDDLVTGAWQDVSSDAAQSGTGGTLQFTMSVDPAQPRRFYRLKIILQ